MGKQSDHCTCMLCSNYNVHPIGIRYLIFCCKYHQYMYMMVVIILCKLMH